MVSHPADKSLNGEVAQEARERGIWINAVDDPQYCDFILPSVYRQGDLVISVSTSGKAPAVGIRIKQKIAGMFGSEYAQYLHLLGLLRHEVSRAFPEDFAARKAAWYRMVDCGALGLVRIGEPEAARQTLLNALHDISDPVGTSRSPLQTAQIKEVVR